MATKTCKLAPIQAGTIYPLGTFLQSVGWGRHALTAAKKRGLKVRILGGRGFIRGDDFLAYLDAQDREQAAAE